MENRKIVFYGHPLLSSSSSVYSFICSACEKPNKSCSWGLTSYWVSSKEAHSSSHAVCKSKEMKSAILGKIYETKRAKVFIHEPPKLELLRRQGRGRETQRLLCVSFQIQPFRDEQGRRDVVSTLLKASWLQRKGTR